MKLHHVIAVLAAGASAASASAQNMKPGLWEVTNNMKSASGEMEKHGAEMQQQMASMPPEQRKMMEEMMAKQGVRFGAGGAITSKTCVTKEMAERNEMPSERSDCRTTRNERRGNTVKVAFTCTNPPSSGEGQYTIVSPEAYTMKMKVNTTASGKPETMNMDMSGKWIGADCGSVRAPARPGIK